MKKFLLTFSILYCFIGLLIGQKDSRDVSSFDGVDVSAGIEVLLVESNKNFVEVDVTKGELDELITEVDGSTLEIKWKSKRSWSWGNNNRSAKVIVHYTELNDLEASSGSSVKSAQTINSENFDVDVSSGASIKIDLDCSNLTVDVSSGASLTLEGNSDEQTANASSGASYRGENMISKVADVSCSSGASAKIHATKELSADVSSGGTIRYAGEPDVKDLDEAKYSGGSIRKI